MARVHATSVQRRRFVLLVPADDVPHNIQGLATIL